MIAVLCISCLLLLPTSVSAAPPTPADADARQSAESFRDALTSGDAARLNPILPASGKVQVRLQTFGPTEAAMSGAQVEVWFRDFFKHGEVLSFEIVRVEQTSDYAVARCRAEVRQADGFRGRVGLRLAMQSEGGRWVLREIRESHE